MQQLLLRHVLLESGQLSLESLGAEVELLVGLQEVGHLDLQEIDLGMIDLKTVLLFHQLAALSIYDSG